MVRQWKKVPTVMLPEESELVELILRKNRNTQLGYIGKWLRVPETAADGKTFLRTALIKAAHEPKTFAHLGKNKIIKQLEKDYHGMISTFKKDFGRYIRNCHACRRNKTPRDKTIMLDMRLNYLRAKPSGQLAAWCSFWSFSASYTAL